MAQPWTLFGDLIVSAIGDDTSVGGAADHTIFPLEGRDPILADVDAGADAVRGDPDEYVVRGRIDADSSDAEVESGTTEDEGKDGQAIGGADEDSVFLARLNAWMSEMPGRDAIDAWLGNDAIADVVGATEMTECSVAMERMCCMGTPDRTWSLVAVGQIGSMDVVILFDRDGLDNDPRAPLEDVIVFAGVGSGSGLIDSLQALVQAHWNVEVVSDLV